MEFWNAFKSVMAAFVGVQKADNLRADFSKKTAMPFIVVGIVMTILFVIAVIGIAKLAISSVS